MREIRWVPVVAVLLLTACPGGSPVAPPVGSTPRVKASASGSPAPEATPSAGVSGGPSGILPSATPTASPTPGASATPTPAASATATATPDPAASATPTPDPAATPTPTPRPSPTPVPGPVVTPAPDDRPFPTAPLTRFQIMYAFDGVANWSPGLTLQGPVHIGRGPIGAATFVPRPAGEGNVSYGHDSINDVQGRSHFFGKRPSGGIGGDFVAVNGLAHPVFQGPVSLAWKPGADPIPDGARLAPGDGSSGWLRIDRDKDRYQAAPTAAELGAIFTHPDNAKGFGDRPGPRLLDRDVPLPGPLATRLGPALGLPAGAKPEDLSWWAGLPDGVYLPTEAMVRDTASAYVSQAPIAGCIYVRGTIQVLRAAVKDEQSLYFLSVDAGGGKGRAYTIGMDRAARTTFIRSVPLRDGERLRDALAKSPGANPLLFQVPVADRTDLAAWGAGSDAGTIGMTFKAGAGARAPFNGVIAVDYGLADPLRDPAAPGVVRPPTATRRPVSGHILALGDPKPANKLALATGGVRGGLADPEVFSTEIPGSDDATGLTIMAAGHVFVQNHVLVAGVGRAAEEGGGGQPLEKALRAGAATAARTKDRLALMADRRVLMGLAAPSGGPGQRGLVLTASLIGLEDPGATQQLVTGDRKYRDLAPECFNGSLGVEGLRYGFGEDPVLELPPGPSIYESDGGGPLTEAPWSRGKLTIFGSLIAAKRGVLGVGANNDYDPDLVFDPRLADLPPPLVP